MGELIPFPARKGWEPALSKRQLANAISRSPRWIEMRMREGLPFHGDERGRRFVLSEVQAWLDRRAS